MYEELKQYGFSDKEVEAYIISLKIGDATTNDISKNSNITRTTIYDIFENLKRKGIAYSYKKEHKTYYGVIEPEKLTDILYKKIDMMNQIIPDLNKLKHTQDNNIPKIEIFEGKEGLIQASYDMLNENEVFLIGGSAEFDSIFTLFQENFANRRVERGVNLFGILGNNFPQHMQKKEVRNITHIKENPEFDTVQCTEFLYADKVLTLIYGGVVYATLIQSKEYCEFRKKVFDEMWRRL